MDISISGLYRLMSDRNFPPGRRLNDIDTRKFWKKETVDQWILDQVE